MAKQIILGQLIDGKKEIELKFLPEFYAKGHGVFFAFEVDIYIDVFEKDIALLLSNNPKIVAKTVKKLIQAELYFKPEGQS
ncbi:MAG: hypothetical protein V3U75_11335 [Methylococcaceae bacterium]